MIKALIATRRVDAAEQKAAQPPGPEENHDRDEPLRARGRSRDADSRQRDRDIGDAPGQVIEALSLKKPGGDKGQPLDTKSAQGQGSHRGPDGQSEPRGIGQRGDTERQTHSQQNKNEFLHCVTALVIGGRTPTDAFELNTLHTGQRFSVYFCRWAQASACSDTMTPR